MITGRPAKPATENVLAQRKATGNINGVKREVEWTAGRLSGDGVTFLEIFGFQGNSIRIEYKGRINGDKMKLTRRVGDIAAEVLVARRTAAKDAAPPRIKLGRENKPVFPVAPARFATRREGIPHGKITIARYESKTVGTNRPVVIYTPPHYSPDQKYPVLYLLHGIGDVETSWWKKGSATAIFDNLYVEQKLTPMIVVMPNGRAARGISKATPWDEQFPAFEAFGKDLLNDLIPYVESHYPVKAGSKNRALVGLSMGGGQTLNIGLQHPESFAWIGGFSSAPNTRPPAELVPKPGDAHRQYKLIWISCGDQDRLMYVSQGVHKHLKESNVPHLWHVDAGGHTWAVWRNNLYLLSQRLFR